MKCPNKNSPEWQELVDEYGEDLASFYWDITKDPERIAEGVDPEIEKAVDSQLETLGQRLLALDKISAMENRKEVESRKAFIRSTMNRLSNERTYEKLLEVSLHQINQVKKTLMKDPKEISAFELYDSMKVIKNLRSITSILAGSPNIKVKKGIDTINRWTTALDLKQKELTKELAMGLAKKYNLKTDPEKLFDAVRDISWLESQTLSPSTSNIPLEQLIDRVIQSINRQSYEILENQFDQNLRNLLDTLGKKKFDLADIKKLTESDGTLIKPFTKKYFSEKQVMWNAHNKLLADSAKNPEDAKLKAKVSASFQNVFKWYTTAHDYYLTPEGREQFEKDLEDTVQSFTDTNGDLTAEGERARAEFIAKFSPYKVGELDEETGLIKITAQNTPSTKLGDGDYVYNTHWHRYLVAQPKAQYRNAKFDQVSEDPLYKFILDRYLEALRMLPHETALDVGNFYKFIEDINFNTVQTDFNLKNIVSGIRDIAQDTYTISTNMAELEGGLVETVVNPVTGEVTKKVSPILKTTDENGRPIPVLRPKTLQDIKEASAPKNPLELLREFYKTAVTYHHQVHALSVLELLQHRLEEMPALNTHPIGSILRTAQDRPAEIQQALENTISRSRYRIVTAISGQTRMDESSMASVTTAQKERLKEATEEWLKNKKKGPMPTEKVFSTVKTLDSIVDYTRMTLIGLKPFTAASNLFIGLLNNYIYASRQKEFEDSHLDQAFRMLFGNMFKFYRVNKLVGKDLEQAEKIAALSEKFGITNTLYENADPNISRRAKNNLVKFFYGLQEGGEFVIANQLMLALMLNTKVLDKQGKEVSVFEIFDRNGQIKPEFDHLEEWKSVEVMRDGENVSKLNEFITTLTAIRHRSQGDYSNPIQAKKGVAGRILFMFRTWLPQAIRERWGAENEMLNFKGRHRSFRDLIVRNTKKGNLEFFGRFALTTLASMTNLLPLGKYRFTKLSKWANDEQTKYLESIGASKIDIENMRANVKELDMLATMTVLSLALMAVKKGDDGDDDDLMTINFLINLINRNKQDLSFFMWPGSAMSIIKDPIPLYKTAQETGDVLNASWDYILTDKPTRFQRGINTGELKLWKETKDLLPIFSALESTESTMSKVFGQDAYRYTQNR